MIDHVCDIPYPVGAEESRELGGSERRGGEDCSEVKAIRRRSRIVILVPYPFLSY